MSKPPLPLAVEAEPRDVHEIDLADLAAGTYFRIGGHLFMAVRVNVETTATPPRLGGDGPRRGIDEINMRLVHAGWLGCDGRP